MGASFLESLLGQCEQLHRSVDRFFSEIPCQVHVDTARELSNLNVGLSNAIALVSREIEFAAEGVDDDA